MYNADSRVGSAFLLIRYNSVFLFRMRPPSLTALFPFSFSLLILYICPISPNSAYFYVLQHFLVKNCIKFFATPPESAIFAIRAYQKAPICELSVKIFICHKLLADSVFCLKMPAFLVHRS